MATPESFRLDIQKFVKLAKGRAKEFATEFIQDIGREVVEATPVKTGNLRNSWYATLNTAPSGHGNVGNVASMDLVADGIKIGDVYYAANGAVYAMRVEFGFVGVDKLGRHYNQPPHSFVRVTLDRAPAIASQVASRIAST